MRKGVGADFSAESDELACSSWQPINDWHRNKNENAIAKWNPERRYEVVFVRLLFKTGTYRDSTHMENEAKDVDPTEHLSYYAPLLRSRSHWSPPQLQSRPDSTAKLHIDSSESFYPPRSTGYGAWPLGFAQFGRECNLGSKSGRGINPPPRLTEELSPAGRRAMAAAGIPRITRSIRADDVQRSTRRQATGDTSC